MCTLLSVERSGYYVWLKRKPGKRELANQESDQKIISIFNDHQGRYRVPRLTKELQEKGETCSKHRVARLMNLGIKAKGKKKFKNTTDSNHRLPVALNLLNRDFKAAEPNQKWCGDISYIWTDER